MICVGKIVGVHGVRGAVKIKSYMTCPEDLFSFSDIRLADGLVIVLKRASKAPSQSATVLGSLQGVNDRDEALGYVGHDLFVLREALPEVQKDHETYYVADLEGMQVQVAGSLVGTIESVDNYGAGDLLNVRTPEGRVALPFQKIFVMALDVDKRTLEVDPDYWTSLKALYE